MNSPRTIASLIGVISLWTAAPAVADTITGQVVNGSGLGVPGVNIDAENAITGDAVDIVSGGTDANGFFSATLPTGLYRITFFPPAPPTTVLLAGIVENVTVVGTTNMGTVALESGVGVIGRVINPNSLPVAGVDLDVIELGSGVKLPTANDSTNALGQFNIAVPLACELQIEPPRAAIPLLAPASLELNLAGNTNLGDLPVEFGFLVSTTILRPGGAAVNDADIDTHDSATGATIFTPGDNTNNSGVATFVVPAGTYDFEVCPPFSDSLVGSVEAAVTVNSTTNLGVTTLQNGVVLMGRITNPAGQGVENADIDAVDSTTLSPIVFCGDDTDAAGNYAVIAPEGALDLEFEVPDNPSLGAVTMQSVAVSGSTVVDAILPGCPCTRYCEAAVNATGQRATIFGSGTNVVSSNNFTLRAENVPNGVPGLFYYGANQIQVPFGDGFRCVGGSTTRLQPPVFSASGTATRVLDLAAPPAAGTIVAGASLNFQFWFRDVQGGPVGFNLSDGLNVIWE